MDLANFLTYGTCILYPGMFVLIGIVLYLLRR